jgi:Fic/DOC family
MLPPRHSRQLGAKKYIRAIYWRESLTEWAFHANLARKKADSVVKDPFAPSKTMVTRKQEQEHLDAIERVVGGFPDGATVDEIEAQAALPISRRTLQRRLAALVDAGRIKPEGQTRSLRYRLAVGVTPVPVAQPTAAAKQRDMFVPLSKAGSALLREVTKPLQLRKPSAYDRDFLESYQPNRTFYLSEPERARLRAIGTPTQAAQPAGTYAQAILSRLLIDLSWNSSRLEGNTYSLLETKRLIDLGETAEGKGAKDAQMILNHKDAIEFLVSSAEDVGFNRYTILNLHALLANELLDDPAAAGRLRREPVGIAMSEYMPPEVPQLIEECFNQILSKASAIADPFEQAFFVMVQLPYLQPFIDVNKRVSRLAANIPLIKNNLAPMSFVGVPDGTYVNGLLAVYELRQVDLLKDVFLWAYERSAARYVAIRQTLGEPDPFRIRHREAMRHLISEIVLAPLNKKEAVRRIVEFARDSIEEEERGRFIEAVETELLSLHEGNYARYRVRPGEFEAWRKVWNTGGKRKERAQ